MEEYEGKPFVLLGVNSDEDREALKSILAEEQLTWRSWWDDGAIDGPIHTKWQIELRPAIHILDHNGVIRFKEIDAQDTVGAIDQLLEELTEDENA